MQPLTPGDIYEADVEIVSSCIVVPKGWRLALSVRGKDYEYTGELSDFAKKFHYATRGTGGMTHNDPDNRPADVLGKVRFMPENSHESMPIIPTKMAHLPNGFTTNAKNQRGDGYEVKLRLYS